MTTASGSQVRDAQQIVDQIGALIGIVKPLADRLMAAGTMDGAMTEGRKIAVEAIRSGAVAVSLGAAADRNQSRSVTAPSDPLQPNTVVVDKVSQGPTDSQSLPIGGVGILGVDPLTLYVQAGLQGGKILADFLRDYTECVETEKTKRTAITADRDKRIVELEAIRSTMQLYLEKTFDERKENFGRMFDTLDQAQASGDIQGMQVMLSGILDLAKSNPFKDLDAFKRSLSDPNFVLEL